MDTEAQSSNKQRVAGESRWRRWLMLYLVIPLGWLLLFFAMQNLANLAWGLLAIAYLGLLYILTFTTMFAEARFAGRLKFWRRALSISGRLVVGGMLSMLYLVIYLLIVYGPGFFH